ncbi:uncharacterized protein PFLUO_LOCUS5868 [Penicillium psychrofluorescens]|uniref:uncharacterized protein n=1 Tax=Penicillium psychrofluorescens TaxID=3158075 RepID=UPI003CCC8FA5
MDEIVDIVRQIGHQQGENTFYRTCYNLLKQLQDKVAQASEDLLRLQQSEALSPDHDFHPVLRVAEELRNSVNTLISQAREAHLEWKRFYPPTYKPEEGDLSVTQPWTSITRDSY